MFWKRRQFVKGGLGVLAGGVIASTEATGQSSGASAVRSSNLFNASPQTPLAGIVDCALAGGFILALCFDRQSGQSWITGTAVSGNRLWTVPLPKGTYLGVGMSGSNVLVHALNYSPSAGNFTRNCVVQFDPTVGAVTVAGLATSAASSAKLTYVGDSLFVRASKGVVELWSASAGIALQSIAPLANSGVRTHVDRLSPGLVSLTGAQGDTMSTLSLSTFALQRYSISGTVIEQAKAAAQSIYARSGMSPAVQIAIIPATGSSGDGTLQALVSPYSAAGAPPLIAIDSAGAATSVGTCQPSSSVTSQVVKLISASGQLGAVHSDGTVLWYNAA